MKRLFVLIAVLLIAGNSWAASVSAHELKTDNGVAAVMHIVPDDNPRSEEPTELYFSFDSENPDFSLDYCKCQVAFQSDENKLTAAALTKDTADDYGGYATVTFPNAGVYKVILRGQASDVSTDTFSLQYTIRVAAGTSAAQAALRRAASTQVTLLTATGLVILGIAAGEGIRRGKRYNGRK